jgi:hypothetical protein
MTPRPSRPDGLTLSTAALDPELLALPAPPRAMRGIAVTLLASTALFALILSAGLTSDVRYAFARSVPEHLGDLAAVSADAARANTFVTAQAELDIARAITYGRTTESDTFELAPVVSNDRLWVEMRLPQGAMTANPPSAFVGRLVPMHSAAFRYRGLGRSSHLASVPMPADAWVLIDGATPASYQWTVGLAGLLALFAAYSLATIARIVRRVHR